MIRSTLRPQRAVIKRSALVLALGACLASGSVFAQKATGEIFGHVSSGATITIESSDTGLKREISADKDGSYRFSQLPTGNYKISADGQTRDVAVRVGTGSEVSFAKAGGATLETIQVQGNAINPIDVSSVESTSIFTQEQIQALPVARDITNVALLAPGTVKGDSAFGNLASFGGASVAENGYYVNGFDITNLRKLVSYANVPFDAIAEQQIKTGGYGAEFGRSLGGVINIVTKKGTNDFKGGVSLYWAPDSLRSTARDARSADPDPDADAYIGDGGYSSPEEQERLNYNVYMGGPIVKDRLFFFVLAEGQSDSDDTYGLHTSQSYKDRSPHGLVKLDWNITDNHILEFTGISNREKTSRRSYASEETVPFHDELTDEWKEKSGGEVYIAKYTGYLTDNFTLSAQAGRLENIETFRTTPIDGTECPAAYDSRANAAQTLYIGCWNPNYLTVIDPTFGPDKDIRTAQRVDAEWHFGDHSLRFGYDHEKFQSGHAGSRYSGGDNYYRYFKVAANGRINGVGGFTPGSEYVRWRHFISNSSTYSVINTAAYLEDSWQVSQNWLIYAGLRSESFENRNASGDAFVKADNQIAPRLGFSWDVNGDASVKVFGNAGRYFIPVAANTNIRASGIEDIQATFHTYTSIDPVTGAPIGLGTQIGNRTDTGSPFEPDPRTVAATNLKPMYQDEFILGAQWALGGDWSVGLRGIKRKVKNGMDDFCTDGAFEDWAADNGYDDIDLSQKASCVIINPGKDVKIFLDLNGDGNLTQATVPASYLGLPKYDRRYSALEFFFEKQFSDKWYLQGSYTWAHSYGNVEGYVNSSLEQDDAGLTQDFDHSRFEDGTEGNLPNDRRHTFKLFGMYQFTDQWRLGTNVLLQSGRPISCNGYVKTDDLGESDQATLGNYGASSFYCINDQGVSVLTHRGDYGRTPWITNIDMSLAYTPEWANKDLTLQLDVFNIFNTRRVTEFDETGERNAGSPEKNPNFLQPLRFQDARYYRLTARYNFSL